MNVILYSSWARARTSHFASRKGVCAAGRHFQNKSVCILYLIGMYMTWYVWFTLWITVFVSAQAPPTMFCNYCSYHFCDGIYFCLSMYYRLGETRKAWRNRKLLSHSFQRRMIWHAMLCLWCFYRHAWVSLYAWTCCASGDAMSVLQIILGKFQSFRHESAFGS